VLGQAFGLELAIWQQSDTISGLWQRAVPVEQIELS
jgi:hypothetical protein